MKDPAIITGTFIQKSFSACLMGLCPVSGGQTVDTVIEAENGVGRVGWEHSVGLSGGPGLRGSRGTSPWPGGRRPGLGLAATLRFRALACCS